MTKEELEHNIKNIDPATKKNGEPIGYKRPAKRLTEKQKAFVSLICQGHSPSDSYRKAYDVSPNTKEKSIQSTANKLTRQPAIRRELDKQFERQQECNLEDSNQLRKTVVERLFKHATESKNEHVQVRALEMLGKASGLFIDRQEITQKVSPEKLKHELESVLSTFDNKSLNTH